MKTVRLARALILVHHIAATQIAAMQIADFVHRNRLPLFGRVIAAFALPVFSIAF